MLTCGIYINMESTTLNPIENQESKTGVIRDEQGKFIPGVSGNPNGRPPMTEEEKLVKKAREKFIDEYIQKLTEALPQITPVLIQKASEGDMNAIKEVNDRVMGKARQSTDITTNGKDLPNPILQLDGTILSNISNKQDNSPQTED